jgi:hypothetical protein
MAKKLSPFLTVVIAFLLVSIAGTIIVPFVMEGFGAQGGEMVQLRTSHVPTMADVDEWKSEQKQIRKEIIDMTGYW